MKYEAKAWKETEGACLRNFNEQAQIDSVNGALALRPQIEKLLIKSGKKDLMESILLVLEVLMLPVCRWKYICVAVQSFQYLLKMQLSFFDYRKRKKFTNKSVVIISSVSGNTKEMVELVDRVHAKRCKSIFIHR